MRATEDEGKGSKFGLRSNAVIAELNAQYPIRVLFNDGRIFNLTLSTRLDEFLAARTAEMKRKK